MEALLGESPKKQEKTLKHNEKEGWKIANYKKSKASEQRVQRGTILVAKIQPNATVKDVWNFFPKGWGILDIILPKKRDKYNNRIGIVNVKNEEAAQNLVGILQYRELMGSKLDLKVVQAKHQRQESGMKMEVNVNRPNNKENKKENFSSNLNIETKQDKKIISHSKNNPEERQVILEPQNEDFF